MVESAAASKPGSDVVHRCQQQFSITSRAVTFLGKSGLSGPFKSGTLVEQHGVTGQVQWLEEVK